MFVVHKHFTRRLHVPALLGKVPRMRRMATTAGALGRICSAGLRPISRVGAVCPIRAALFGVAWTIVTAVSAFDGYFAWRYREVFQEWELNPLARAFAHSHGLAAVLTFKAAVVLFAVAVALYCHCRRRRLGAFYTLIMCGLHLALGAHYLAGYLQHSHR